MEKPETRDKGFHKTVYSNSPSPASDGKFFFRRLEIPTFTSRDGLAGYRNILPRHVTTILTSQAHTHRVPVLPRHFHNKNVCLRVCVRVSEGVYMWPVATCAVTYYTCVCVCVWFYWHLLYYCTIHTQTVYNRLLISSSAPHTLTHTHTANLKMLFVSNSYATWTVLSQVAYKTL